MLTRWSAEATLAARRGISAAERGQHTIPMTTAKATAVAASHNSSPTGFCRPALVGKALIVILHPLPVDPDRKRRRAELVAWPALPEGVSKKSP